MKYQISRIQQILVVYAVTPRIRLPIRPDRAKCFSSQHSNNLMSTLKSSPEPMDEFYHNQQPTSLNTVSK